MERVGFCFVEGCFTYDLAVQIVGTLGAFLVAAYVFWRTQRGENAKAKEQARLHKEQIDRAVAALEQDRRQWLDGQSLA